LEKLIEEDTVSGERVTSDLLTTFFDAGIFLGLFGTENGGDMFLRNVD
jgi:hypothetical protein